MSLAWIISLVIGLISLTEVLCSCYAPPVQLPRCVRNIPPGGFHLIPAALYSNGHQQFIRPLMTPDLGNFKRPTRQQQSAVVQQITINQNAAISSGDHVGFGRPSFGFGGGRGGRPFGAPHHFHDFGKSQGFGRPFGGFRGRSYDESPAEVSSTKTPLTMPRCPLSYVFSCEPTITPVSCGSNKKCPYS